MPSKFKFLSNLTYKQKINIIINPLLSLPCLKSKIDNGHYVIFKFLLE